MSVYRRKYGSKYKWYVYLVLPDRDRYRRVVGTKKQVEQVERKIQAEIAEDKWEIRRSEDIPFSDLVGEYLEYIKANNAASTAKIRKYRIESHLLPFFGNIPLSQITPQMVDKYKASRVKESASSNTINRELANLSHMLNLAIRWRYTNRNAVSNVDKMKVPEKHPRFLEQDEIGRLIEAARDSHLYPLIVAAIHTGMRKSELLNLKWSDVKLSRATVTIQAKEDWHTKNYRSRTLQMTPVLQRVLAEHKKMQKRFGFESDYVFSYQGRKVKWGNDITFDRLAREAGLSDATLHTLRHTFASQLVMAGVPLRDVQELMGHRSFETTLQYAHLSENHIRQQVMKLPFANG